MISKIFRKINPESKFAKFWDNKRLRALVLLPLWIIFFVFVYISFAIPYRNGDYSFVNNTIVSKQTTYEEMLSILQNHNYHYKFLVISDETKIIYEGNRLYEQIVGEKETDTMISKFYISDEDVYEVSLGILSPVMDADLNPYNGYLDIDNVINMLQDYEYEKIDNQISYDLDGVYVKISITASNISQIEISENNNKYILEFSRVGEITSITY